MKLLLDSHVLVWWHDDDGRLGEGARRAIRAKENGVWVSVASVWELAVKQAAGRLTLRDPIADILRMYEFAPLAIALPHATAAAALPRHHGDPFDRMLVAQAQIEEMILVSHDAWIAAYGVPVLWT